MTDEWINIKDRLPMEGIPCLLYITYPKGTILNCIAYPLRRCDVRVGGLNCRKVFVSIENQYDELRFISHWMPLPSPPGLE